ncbi:MAG: GGDEF/EAL domain-containing response regulator [Gammaproteobacteria bacterium]
MTSEALAQSAAVIAGAAQANPPLRAGGTAPLRDAAIPPIGAAEKHANALIMMVDDEPTTTEVLQMFLEAHGYFKFVVTNDSREAMKIMAEKQPDVLLLDLMMPGVSGFEVLAGMRERETLRHIPVIMLTSSVDAETKLRALELGATDFLGKPVDPSELALRLRNTLRAKAHQDRLTYYDSLTGLPNRKQFHQRLERALVSAGERNRYCAVLHFDLDRFQNINDSFGHGLGDMVLKAVAQRLEGAIMLGDVTQDLSQIPIDEPFVARLGGDEFGIVLPELDSVGAAVHTAERVRAAFAQPFVLVQDEMFLSTAIGIAVSPHDGNEPDQLLQKATAATAHAKQKGLKEHQFYAPDLNRHVSERVRLENLMHLALERNQFELNYQPKIDVDTGDVIGAEALLRWQLPDTGYVSPGDFIPIAEESGLIVDIGANVFRRACEQISAWEAEGFPDLRVAVNVSALQFRNTGFLEMMQEAITSTGINGYNLTVELTESVLMENVVEAARILDAVRDIGPKISIDDFGTGYSSLSYLKRFAIDELKIDGSFLRDLPADEDNCAIVSSIIALAQGLNLSVVAEGVEHEAQLEFLRERNCRSFQGFIAAPALPPERYVAFLRVAQERGWPAAAAALEQKA